MGVFRESIHGIVWIFNVSYLNIVIQKSYYVDGLTKSASCYITKIS